MTIQFFPRLDLRVCWQLLAATSRAGSKRKPGAFSDPVCGRALVIKKGLSQKATMGSFDLHVHNIAIDSQGLVNLYLPPSALDTNLTQRLTQVYQIQLLYLFVTNIVNVVKSPISCYAADPRRYEDKYVEKHILHSSHYESPEDLLFDLRVYLQRFVVVKTTRLKRNTHLTLANRLTGAVKIRLTARLAWILGLKYTANHNQEEIEVTLQGSETLVAPFPIDLFRGNHFAHLLSIDAVLSPPTYVYCTACLKQQRVASSLASLIWQPSEQQQTTVFAKQLKHQQGVTGHLTRENFTIALLDGELRPFPSGPLTRVSVGFKFTQLSLPNVKPTPVD